MDTVAKQVTSKAKINYNLHPDSNERLRNVSGTFHWKRRKVALLGRKNFYNEIIIINIVSY